MSAWPDAEPPPWVHSGQLLSSPVLYWVGSASPSLITGWLPVSGDSQSSRPAPLTWQLPSISKPAGAVVAVWAVVGHGRSGFTTVASAGATGSDASPPATRAPPTMSRVTRPNDAESFRLRFNPTLLSPTERPGRTRKVPAVVPNRRYRNALRNTTGAQCGGSLTSRSSPAGGDRDL